MRFRLKKGDLVRVITGKDRGKESKVLKVLRRQARVLVEGVNLHKKHRRARARGQKGEIITLSHPMHISNVMLICPSCHKPTRIGVRLSSHERGPRQKERICKKCEAGIP